MVSNLLASNSNPLREGIANRLAPEPCSLVIFGATGDLTHRKLIPALYNLAAEGALPPDLAVVGFARREKTDEEFRKELETSTKKYSRTPVSDTLWNSFATSISYQCSAFDSSEGYRALAQKLAQEDAKRGTSGNRLFYLAVAPDQFAVILHHLKESGLSHSNEKNWARVIIEKPFGIDLKTARNLNDLVHESFPESSTYRIDHYLGKETAQNIMVFRFANSLFESLWNANHIDHVQITAAEPLGVEGRAGYYDKAGAMRDMVQNHLLQLLTLTAMEPPTSMSADAIRDEKVKVLRSLRPLTGDAVFKHVVRAQYAEGTINGISVPAYRKEQGVVPHSTTESYVALQIAVDNWRWAGVPFFVRAGKRMPKGATEIAITFKSVPPVLFNAAGNSLDQNVLVIRIQPDEGVSLRMSAKMPGSMLRIEPVKMDFHYGTSFGKQTPEAYERLLLDAMSGDATLFARSDEVEQAWSFVDGIEEAWQQSSSDLVFYRSGTWGPDAANDLLERQGVTWRRL
ncbi:MAG: glucose-6-phosphate dehydrogenase [Verrucomicrobia bacterium RIFCSPHIGHO2_12_FULL_41_10]|nr:MAG: glucose-6-phosphate dehydrogenase [Verrucomicrobia bacterium RIFCSPHIGHO2_12_FULL_41_10]